MNRQEIENKINEIENNFKSEIDKLKQELNKDKEWKPKYDEEYYFYNKDYESVDYTLWSNEEIDNIRLKNKVIFKTEAEAQRYADYQKAKEEYSYDFSKEEWEDDDIPKSYIYYDYEDKRIATSICRYSKDIGNLYFKTIQQAQDFIDKYKDEILEFEFGVKEN